MKGRNFQACGNVICVLIFLVVVDSFGVFVGNEFVELLSESSCAEKLILGGF